MNIKIISDEMASKFPSQCLKGRAQSKYPSTSIERAI